MSDRESEAASSGEGRTPEEVREDIEETRGELGDTVAAVTEKTDVKKQAQAKVDEVKAQAADKVEEVKQNPAPLAIAAAVVALLVLWRLLRR